MQRDKIILASTSLISMGAGCLIGGYLARRKLETYFMNLAEAEIASVRDAYKKAKEELDSERREFEEKADKDLEDLDALRTNYEKQYKTGKFETPESAVNHLIRREESISEEDPEITIPDEVVVALESYASNSGGKMDETVDTRDPAPQSERKRNRRSTWPPDEYPAYRPAVELEPLDKDNPYVIPQQEFLSSIRDYEQNTLTYYAGDGVLADDRDQSIENRQTMIGDTPIMFGHLSQDQNIVYIRNDKLRMEFEVVRSEGLYSEEVLGFTENRGENG